MINVFAEWMKNYVKQQRTLGEYCSADTKEALSLPCINDIAYKLMIYNLLHFFPKNQQLSPRD